MPKIALAAATATIVFNVSPVWVIAAGAVLGIAYQFAVSAAKGEQK